MSKSIRLCFLTHSVNTYISDFMQKVDKAQLNQPWWLRP